MSYQYFILLILLCLVAVYGLMKAWHEYRVNKKNKQCVVCHSKRRVKIRRGGFIRMLPANSRKEFCKECKSKYIIMFFFHWKIIILLREKKPVELTYRIIE